MDHMKKKRGLDELSDDTSTSSSESTEFSYKKFRPKKKSAHRRSDAGRRYQRGRVYDSAFGITCHFCRQKTTDKHVVCCSGICVLAYCGNCLYNRHGEDIHIETAEDNYSWICPKCRGGCGQGCRNCCNCTFCRKAQNLRPPRIPSSEMQEHGFDNVHDYLIHLETGESPESISARKLGKGWCLTQEKRLPKMQQCKKKTDSAARDADTGKYSWELPHNTTSGHSEKDATKDLNEAVCSGTRQDRCSDNTKSVPRDDKNLKETATTKADKGEGSHEGLNSHGRSVLKSPAEPETRKGSYNMAKSLNCEQIERDARNKGSDKVACSVTPGTSTDNDIFSLLFSSRNNFRGKLEEKLRNAFDSQELKELRDAIKCRKPVYKTALGTTEGAYSFLINKAGHSYIDHFPDLVRKLTATSDEEEKLKLLRGFFFWLEHSSMPGSFKPWLETDNDAECVELAGPDFQVLGVLINLDEHQSGEEQEGAQGNAKHDIKESLSRHAYHEKEQEETLAKAKHDIKESVPMQGKINFNWDEEDVKPKIEGEPAKFSSFNTRIHVKEEPDMF